MEKQRTYKDLLEEAEAEVESLTPEEVLAIHENDDVIIVDLREPSELLDEGRIPGSFHAPRGNLEFWACPSSPFHREQFASGKRLILHCAGGWRSALAAQTLQRMGIPRVAHMKGGMGAWKKAGGPTVGAAPPVGKRVTGLGGVFFKSNDPTALKAWYRDHLGVDVTEFGAVFRWQEERPEGGVGYTVWSPMSVTARHFEPSERQYMINYRVADMTEVVAALQTAGARQIGDVESHPNGRFAWFLDPEGTKVELWEPVPSDSDPYL